MKKSKVHILTVPFEREYYDFCNQCNNMKTLIRIITKLPNSEQSYKGKVKTYKYKCIYTDKISQQPENCENRNDPDLVQAFQT